MLEALYFAKQQLNGFLVMKHLRRKRAKQILPTFLSLLEQFKHSPARALTQTLPSWLEPHLRLRRFTMAKGISEGFHTDMDMLSRRTFRLRNLDHYRLQILAQGGWNCVVTRVG